MEHVEQRAHREPRWHAAIAVLLALGLYVTLPQKFIVGPVWVLPLIVLLTLMILLALSPHRKGELVWHRALSIGQIAALYVFNAVTIGVLFELQLAQHPKHPINGAELLQAAVQIWLTNMLVYALWFWEIGQIPGERHFLFPQMQGGVKTDWRPGFIDYLFLAFTNATAFSPTDTLPLTALAKVLMMLEALASLVTVALIAGRAINILGS